MSAVQRRPPPRPHPDGRRRTEPRRWSPADTVTVAVAGAVAGTGLITWAAGQLAGWLTSGRWPPMPPGAVAGIVARIPAHLGNLAAAWPVPARSQLPGEVLMVAVFALLLAASGALGVATVFTVRVARTRCPGRAGLPAPVRSGARWGRMAPTRTGRGARWATQQDLSSLRVRAGDHAGRVVLGRQGRTLVATESHHSVLVLGPTRPGWNVIRSWFWKPQVRTCAREYPALCLRLGDPSG